MAASAAGLAVVSSVALSAALAQPSTHSTKSADASSKVYFGTVTQTTTPSLGVSPAQHVYGLLNGGVPVGRMITMRDPGVPWSTVAAAQPGSSIYTNIVRWANTIKTRPGPIFFAYHHEPEASRSATYGTSSQFVAAYRHVVDIFRAQGVSNVEYTWQMTSYAFVVSSSDKRAAAKWYPGDYYVDNVAADAYNWYNCGPGHGHWKPISDLVDPVISFAKAHGKKVILGEYGTETDPRRAAWIANSQQYFIANSAYMRGAYYFDRETTVPSSGCSWPLTSTADKNALKAIVMDTTHFTG